MTYDLCNACATLLEEGYTVTKLAGNGTKKITCAHCREVRFGATYRIAKKGVKSK